MSALVVDAVTERSDDLLVRPTPDAGGVSTRSSPTDWQGIVALYDALLEAQASPIVELNRAVAISRCQGPAAGLACIAELERLLAGYHLFYATRADFLERLGRDPRPDLVRALSLVTNDGERRLLERRLGQLARLRE